MVYAFEPNFK